MRLKGKIALITGAAGGIGSATALCFAEEGARVILADIDTDGCEAVCARIREQGGDAMCAFVDVNSEELIVGLFSSIREQYGRLDILVAVAGGDLDPFTPADEITGSSIDSNLALNLRSCMLCCREAARLMKPQQYGRIVTMSSLVYRGAQGQFSYAAAKGGIASYTRALAMTLGSSNITVNALAPALVDVPAFRKALGSERWEVLLRESGSRYPLNRVAQPLDVAKAALFLASDDAAFITGQILEISGGARL
ncbi:MAG: SDR family oxidoreductase [Chlorobium sp.]|uniref:SDR family NAD(P)-dependent oxidoreductase n=1 Tax=Chlorobium sp. TaxID=1095 RepID=UPI001D84FB60|nr:SDR family NAD(P)-dependent oxidoreductase [Chlorobium sp.]MBN1279172.1 SDR family oxidoreductase [Chlorobiaceae bacterium]MCF8216377.1 SDR family oxidoreductase [Chlorobium sp.]MCF8271280.1 SDR family oxidoreductase [Chlorobium sp.]MCF8287654.1 SDR family oxidoreductase [Chlorobium sp.]MCF8291219.1 SDR family oxidoreductase [Chlorobium sp.]